MNSALIIYVLKVGHEANLSFTVARCVSCKGTHDTYLDGSIC